MKIYFHMCDKKEARTIVITTAKLYLRVCISCFFMPQIVMYGAGEAGDGAVDRVCGHAVSADCFSCFQFCLHFHAISCLKSRLFNASNPDAGGGICGGVWGVACAREFKFQCSISRAMLGKTSTRPRLEGPTNFDYLSQYRMRGCKSISNCKFKIDRVRVETLLFRLAVDRLITIGGGEEASRWTHYLDPLHGYPFIVYAHCF